MNEDLLPYKLAERAKTIGFDEITLAYYYPACSKTGYALRVELPGDKFIWDYDVIRPFRNSTIKKHSFTAPTFAEVFRWFRKERGYNSYIKEETKGTYRFYVDKFEKKNYVSGNYETYEEAEADCLDKLIKIAEDSMPKESPKEYTKEDLDTFRKFMIQEQNFSKSCLDVFIKEFKKK